MAHKITIKDFLLRTWLDIKINYRYVFKIKKEGDFSIPQYYKEVFSDDFKNWTDNWEDGGTWWGTPYHPNYLNMWYDKEQVKTTEEGVSFSAIVNPRYFDEIKTTIPNSIGLIRSNMGWKYGIFEFVSKMPSGTYLWPALWMSGMKHWPPEIDILEGYSDNTTDFHKNVKLQSNVHRSDGKGGSDAIGGRSHKLPINVSENFIKYVVWWEEDFIKIYYNGYLVRHITDREMLDGMFEEQRFIIGTGLQVGFSQDNLTPMVVNKVAVYQK